MTILLAERQRANRHNEDQLRICCCLIQVASNHGSDLRPPLAIMNLPVPHPRSRDHPRTPEQCHYDLVPVYSAHPRRLSLPNLEKIEIAGTVLSDNACEIRSKQACIVRHDTHLRHSPGVLSLSHLGSEELPRSGMTCRRQKVQGLQINGVGDQVIGNIGILPPSRLAWRYFPVTSENVGWSGSRSSSSFEVSLRAFQSDRGQSI